MREEKNIGNINISREKFLHGLGFQPQIEIRVLSRLGKNFIVKY